jgi:hypothetical protein
MKFGKSQVSRTAPLGELSRLSVVYYESMKRKIKIKPIYECRCNERLQTKRFTRHKDEVNKREVCECEG